MIKKKYFLNANIIDPQNSIEEIGGLIVSDHAPIIIDLDGAEDSDGGEDPNRNPEAPSQVPKPSRSTAFLLRGFWIFYKF